MKEKKIRSLTDDLQQQENSECDQLVRLSFVSAPLV